MNPAKLITARLRLVQHEPEHLRALIRGTEFYEHSSGMKAAKGLREFIVSPDVSPEWRAALETATDADPWRYGFALMHRDSGIVIGNSGFAGPPDANGMVEIAYGVVPDYEGKGFATEAAQALIAYAEADARVRTICAHTLPRRNASTRILEKCGFRRTGEVSHPTDGLIWRREKPAATA
ncbi:MAG: GNAT family N-acetyltransferase [Chthoniobacterales bacterium]